MNSQMIYVTMMSGRVRALPVGWLLLIWQQYCSH